MPGAIIRIDQVRPGPITSTGSPGVARDDIWVGNVVNLVSTLGIANTDQLWTMLDRPSGSTAVLASVNAITSTFTPDIPGSYRIKLLTNALGGAEEQTLIVAARYDAAGVLTFRGWRIPAFREKSAEANFTGNTRGWTTSLEFIYRAIDTALSLAVDLADNARVTGILSSAHGGTDQNAAALAANPNKALVVNALGTAVTTAAVVPLPLPLADLDPSGGVNGNIVTRVGGVPAWAAPAVVDLSTGAVTGVLPGANVAAATGATPGALSAVDKTKLDGLQKQGPSVAIALFDIDWSLGGVFTKTLPAGLSTFTFSNDTDGWVIVVEVTGAASTVAWPAGIRVAGGGGMPVQTASGTDVYTFVKTSTGITCTFVQAVAP